MAAKPKGKGKAKDGVKVRTKEVQSKLELAHGKAESKCEMCLEDKAEAFCRHCAKFICAECVKAHQRLKRAFPGHKISMLEELNQEPSYETCKVHDQPKIIFCYDCDTLICHDCTIKDHFGHNHKVAGPETKKLLNQQLEPLRMSNVSLSCAIKEIQTTIAEVEDQGSSVANTIKISCKGLHAIIDNHQESLLTEAATRVQQKIKRLSDQEKSLSTAYASAQSVIECLEHSPNDKVVYMRAEMQSRIEREIQEQQKEQENLVPVEEADMGVEVSCAEDLKQLCLTKAKIMQLAIEHAITGEGVESAEVSKMSEFRVVAALSNGESTKRAGVVECHLHSLAKGSTTKCTVDHIQGGEYRVQYTPTVRGRHELIVTGNGQEIAGSPFPVFVSIHPTQLGKPVQVITGIKSPWHMALTSAGNIIVRDSRAAIIMLDKTGKRLMQADYRFTDPLGVAVDSTDGCVYVTDNKDLFNNSKIIKLSPDLQVKKIFDCMSGLLYRGVSVVGDEVMVCCLKDSVVVYTKELEFVREIGSHGDGPCQFGGVRGMFSDEHGKLYICDLDKSCVQVFASDGEFLRSIDSADRDGVNRLNGPRGVCVSGGYVYVTNYHGHSVSVFTTDGDYVTSFGQRGRGYGNLLSPCGVCVDQDGFVCVSEFSNNRIQIF